MTRVRISLSQPPSLTQGLTFGANTTKHQEPEQEPVRIIGLGPDPEMSVEFSAHGALEARLLGACAGLPLIPRAHG